MSSSGAHLAQLNVKLSDFLPDQQELDPVHEGFISNLRLRTTYRAARATRPRSWLVGASYRQLSS